MSEHKISEPLGVQSHDVLEWSRSLRSRSPSPSEHRTRSRTPSPGRGSKPLSRSRTLSPGRLTKSLQNTPRKGNLCRHGCRLMFNLQCQTVFGRY